MSQALAETAELIRDYAYNACRERMPRERFLRVHGNTMTLSPRWPGEQLETQAEITLQQDGTVRTDIWDLKLLRDRAFDQAWKTIVARAYHLLQQEVDQSAATDLREFLSLTPEGRDRLLPEASREMRRAAQGLAALSAGGYIRNPAGYGTARLRNFLGPETFALTLELAGNSATLRDFNTTVRNRAALQEALRQNPNAAALWMHLPRSRDAQGITAEDVLQQAHEAFMRQMEQVRLRALPEREWPLARPWEAPVYARTGIACGDPRNAWEALAGLNRQAVRHRPPTEKYPDAITSAADVSAQAGGTLPYTAAVLLLSPADQYRALPHQLRLAFAAESLARRQDPRRGGQKQLAWEFALAALQSEKLEQARNGRVPDPGSWAGWLRALEVQGNTDRPERARKKRKAAPARSREQYTAQAEQRARLDQEAARTVEKLLEAREALRNASRLETGPDRVALWVTGRTEPVFEMRKLTAGNLRLEGAAVPEACLSRQGGKPSGEDLARLGGAPFRAALKQVREKLGPEASPRRTARALWDLMREMPEDQRQNADQELVARRLNAAAWRLVDPGTLRAAARCSGGGQVTVGRYNIAAQARTGKFLDQLARTNPGALAWAMCYWITEEPLRHPGQLIAAVREQMEQAGLDPRHRRAAFRIGPKEMQMITALATGPGQAAGMLNALGNAGVSLGPEILGRIAPRAMNSWTRQQYGSCRNPRRGSTDPNRERALMLLCRQAQGATEESLDRLLREMEDVDDYVRDRSDQGEHITATSWNGLRKASDRWHREIIQHVAEAEWERILEDRDGAYLAWNSRLDEVRIGQLQFVALTDELQLHQESQGMRHCVRYYGPDCAEGGSRIFAVLRDGRHAGTTEIRREQDRWLHAQTRGYRNAPAQELQEAAEELARRYQDAGDRAGSDRKCWRINHLTGERTQDPRGESPRGADFPAGA